MLFYQDKKTADEQEIALKQTYKKYDKSLCIYVKCYGPIKNIDEVIVVVGDHTYKIKGPINAIDICFKIIKVLERSYPVASKPIWDFIGNYAFELKEKVISSNAINLGNEILRTLEVPVKNLSAAKGVSKESSSKRKSAKSDKQNGAQKKKLKKTSDASQSLEPEV